MLLLLLLECPDRIMQLFSLNASTCCCRPHILLGGIQFALWHDNPEPYDAVLYTVILACMPGATRCLSIQCLCC